MHRLLLFGVSALAALALSGACGVPGRGPRTARSFARSRSARTPMRPVSTAGRRRRHDGAPVRAPAAGTVTFAGSVPTHGRGVTILTQTATPSRCSTSARSASSRARRSPRATPSGRWARAATPSTQCRTSTSGSASRRPGRGLRRPARPAARATGPRPAPAPLPHLLRLPRRSCARGRSGARLGAAPPPTPPPPHRLPRRHPLGIRATPSTPRSSAAALGAIGVSGRAVGRRRRGGRPTGRSRRVVGAGVPPGRRRPPHRLRRAGRSPTAAPHRLTARVRSG